MTPQPALIEDVCIYSLYLLEPWDCLSSCPNIHNSIENNIEYILLDMHDVKIMTDQIDGLIQ